MSRTQKPATGVLANGTTRTFPVLVDQGRSGGEAERSVSVSAGATVGHLAEALGVVTVAAVDGRPVEPHHRLDDLALAAWSVVALAPPEPAAGRPPELPAVATLRQVAGPATGATVPLVPGRARLGPGWSTAGFGAGLPTAGLLDLDVHEDATVTIRPLLDAEVHLDGCRVTEPTTWSGGWLRAGGAILALAPAEPSLPPLPVGPDGRRSLPPRRADLVRRPEPPSQVEVPGPPEAPRRAEPVSWVAALAPVPLGLVAALAMRSSLALLFGLSGILYALARWADDRWRVRRDGRRYAAELAAVEVRTVRAADEAGRRFAAALRANDDPAALRAAADHPHGAGLWTGARGGRVTVAVGGRRVPLVRSPAQPDALDVRLDDVPILLDLADGPTAVVGPPAVRDAIVRSLVLQVASDLGPDVLTVVPAHARGDEPWWQRLPHGHGGPWTAHQYGGPWTAQRLVVVDSCDHFAELSSWTIVVADSRATLPLPCPQVVVASDDGSVSVHGGDAEDVVSATACCVDRSGADAWARALGRWRPASDATAPPDSVDLAELLDLSAGPVDAVGVGPAGTPQCLASDLAEALLDRWATADSGLAVPVGRTCDGPFVLDLVADGPHALVAGTTGAGKSELLRSWILALAATTPPWELHLVLVDFKGGGAFDALRPLPHVVDVVTDLDDGVAERMLRAVRAEVRRREAFLRAADGGTRPARLVIVVDEFATLAAELPGFVHALVDVAQRGRSLGLHLVLATQHPAGVVDVTVRANTNLRIALRVQGDADSLDVIDRVDAARLPSIPGRAVVRRAGRSATVQFAWSGGPVRGAAQAPVVVRRPEVRHGTAGVADPPAPSFLAALVDAAALAAARLGHAPAQPPWLPPLPGRVDPTAWSPPPQLAGVHGRGGELAVPLGLLDEPDARRQDPQWWYPDVDGGLLVVGGGPGEAAAVAAGVLLETARRHGPGDVHLHALDVPRTLGAALGALPHTGTVVVAGDDPLAARWLDEAHAEVEARRAGLRPTRPVWVVAVADPAALVERYEHEGRHELADRLVSVLREGASVGVVAVACAPSERGLTSRLLASFPQRIVLALADPIGAALLGADRPPPRRGTPGRALLVPGDLDLQSLHLGDAERLADAGERVREAGHAVASCPPRRVRCLGEVVAVGDLPVPAWSPGTGWSIPIGLDPSLEPVVWHLAPGLHALVAGPPRSGRSAALALVALQAARALDGDRDRASVVVIGRAPAPVLPGVAVIDPWAVAPAEVVEEIRSLLVAPGPALVLVDDADQLPGEVAAVLAPHAERPRPGLTLVAAARPEALRSVTSWAAPLRTSRTGLLLQPQPGDGDVLRVAVPLVAPRRRAGAPMPPGRGMAVSPSAAVPVQVAWTGA